METEIDRPKELPSKTYKVRLPTMKEAYYITISDMLKDNTYHPWEMFVSTKNLVNAGYITALTKLISKLLRSDIPIKEVISELKSVYDPEGGFFYEGEQVYSFSCVLGKLLERHIDDTDKYKENDNVK